MALNGVSREKTALARVEQKLQTNNSNIATNDDNLSQNDKDLAVNASAQQKSTDKITTLEGQIADVKTQRSGVQNEIDSLNKTMSTSTDDDVEYSMNQRKLEDLNLSLQDLDNQNSVYTDEKQDQETTLKTQKEEGVSLDKTEKSLKAEKEELKTENEKLNKEKTEAEEKAKTETTDKDNVISGEGKPEKEQSSYSFDKIAEKAENLYKNGVYVGDNLHMDFKHQKLNYELGETGANVYAGYNGIGANWTNDQWHAGGKMNYGLGYDVNAGYDNGNFSANANYNSSNGFRAGFGYKDEYGKYGVSASASTNKEFDVSVTYNPSSKISLSLEANQKRFGIGFKANI